MCAHLICAEAKGKGMTCPCAIATLVPQTRSTHADTDICLVLNFRRPSQKLNTCFRFVDPLASNPYVLLHITITPPTRNAQASYDRVHYLPFFLFKKKSLWVW